jgi:hypothetical protein
VKEGLRWLLAAVVGVGVTVLLAAATVLGLHAVGLPNWISVGAGICVAVAAYAVTRQVSLSHLQQSQSNMNPIAAVVVVSSCGVFWFSSGQLRNAALIVALLAVTGSWIASRIRG